MSLSVGIVGLPNVGKSTLFQALTKKQVDIANYPFCTIDPNVGVVKVPDERLEQLSRCFRSAKTIPAIVEFVDIAGLVRGAHKGEGLGNQFLSHIREADAIAQVVRCFEHADIVHVEQNIDPVRDMETIKTELLLKDMETLEKRLASTEKEARTGDKAAIARKPIFEELKTYVNEGRGAREYLHEHPETEEILKELQLLSAKPVIYLLNSTDGAVPDDLKKRIESERASFIIMNIKDELDALVLSEQEAQELGVRSRLPELIRKAYEILELISFFTTGADESRAWTVKQGTKAPVAAGVIHTDFREKFIRADVIPWDVLLKAGTYQEAYAKGLVRTEGKEYIVQDGDVLEIKHG